jgi:hypothetical protein
MYNKESKARTGQAEQDIEEWDRQDRDKQS